jgi:hypothetical protein
VHNDKAVVLDNNKVKYVKAVMYRTVSNNFKPGETFDYDMLVFFTPAGIKSYITNFPDYMDRKVAIAAMGTTTLEEAKKVGLNVDVTIGPEAPSMASAIELFLKKAKAQEEREAAKAAKKPAAKPAAAQKTAKPAAAKPAAQKPLTGDDDAAKRSAAARHAAQARWAKVAAEKEAAAKRSSAARKAAATRKAKAEAAKKKDTGTK